MKFFITVLVLGSAIGMAYSLCNTCSLATGVACVAENRFRFCVDGVPQSSVMQCPNGTICTPNTPTCAVNGTAPPSCTRCGTCDSNQVFACTGYNSFTLCLGNPDPVNPTANLLCPEGRVCSIHSPNICIDENQGGATCPWSEPETTTETTTSTTTTTTTPNPITNPDQFCEDRKSPILYAVSSDTTCRQYISCILFNDKLYGNVYECPTSKYFNSTAQSCTSRKPANCV